MIDKIFINYTGISLAISFDEYPQISYYLLTKVAVRKRLNDALDTYLVNYFK